MNTESGSIPSNLNSFVDVLRLSSLHEPEHATFAFLADGETEERVLTAGELDCRARAIAASLQALGVTNERALLLYPAGLEFLAGFFGCLYAGVVAVPIAVPRANRPMPRLRAIVANARPCVVLTSSSLIGDAPKWREQVEELRDRQCVATDQIDMRRADDWRDPCAGRDTLAFLQYTSGSTAASKGVMLTHGNLLHNSAVIRRCFGSTAESRGVFWLPLYHDMGLIGGVLQTLYCGGRSTLFSPVAFLQRPLRWLQTISRAGATISGAPNFAYELCARKVTADQKTTLDLSSWRVAFNGAEPIRPETLDRFVDAFASCGFRREAFLPCYGLAEASLMVSGRGPAPSIVRSFRASAIELGMVAKTDGDGSSSADVKDLVSNGTVPADHRVAIVDPVTARQCPSDHIGEIWVAGPSVALGYWNQPAESEATFGARITDTGEGPFLRTGDLGFLDAGELFVTGRLKDLLVIRGRNVYPQDIEWSVQQSHPALRPEAGAAFAVEVESEERLVIVHEVERLGRTEAADAVIATIRHVIADEHDLDVHAVVLLKSLSIPRTSSGKVQRHLCREAFRDNTLEVVAQWFNERTEPEGQTENAGPQQTVPSASPSFASVRDWLISHLAAHLRIAPDQVDCQRQFASFGLSSVHAVGLAGELQDWLGCALSPTLVYEYPTVDALAGHLASTIHDAYTNDPVDERSSSSDADTHNVEASSSSTEPIAIIGIGCRFPGAESPEAFWRLLSEGREAVGEMPAGRLALLEAESNSAGETVFRRGGFLPQVDQFDADFFGIAPREAVRIDPQQRLLLEVAWEAFEDAGLPAERLAGTRAGVFVGISTNDYAQIASGNAEAGDAYVLTGNAASIAANRLSYQFDFRGPSLAIDTACSSSLVAVHLACESLRRGESSVALAGGVNLILSAEVAAQFIRAGFLAPDGRCKAFAAGANGYVRGEGCGLVVLKPLAQARADGDLIYAVIRGGAINQDGRTNGLTAPSRASQQAVLRAAYRNAGIDPRDVNYVEAHGTGTFLGDPIEAKALASVLGDRRADRSSCAIGSVKTNIGHLEAAAGVAGLIKVALALKHRKVPASLHFDEPNPHIPFGRISLHVQREFGKWECDGSPVIAGVSAFGFGGTNAHVVLSSADDRLEDVSESEKRSLQEKLAAVGGDGSRSDAKKALCLLTLSARSRDALGALADSYRRFLAEAEPAIHWVDIAASSFHHRTHHDYRLALVAGSREEAISILAKYAAGESDPALSQGRVPSTRSGDVEQPVVVDSQGDRGKTLGTIAALYVQGRSIDWARVEARGRVVRLPLYAWQRTRFWPDSGVSRALRSGQNGNGHAGELTSIQSARVNGHAERRVPGITNGTAHALTIDAGAEGIDELLYELTWEESARLQPPTANASGNRASSKSHSTNGTFDHDEYGCWLIFEDACGVGQHLRALLEERGSRCVSVRRGEKFCRVGRERFVLDQVDPEGYRRLRDSLDEFQGPVKVAYLWGLNAPHVDDVNVRDAESFTTGVCVSVRLVDELISSAARDTRAPLSVPAGRATGCSAHTAGNGSVAHGAVSNGVDRRAGALTQEDDPVPRTRFWIVTRGAQAVGTEARLPEIFQTPLWGMGRSLHLRHPQDSSSLIDLDPAASVDDAAGALVAEIVAPEQEAEVVLRDGTRFVPRLNDRSEKKIPERSMPIRSDGTYLITGGLGALGLRVSRWLVERGARRIVLVSRRGLPDRATWDSLRGDDPARATTEVIQRLERLGATILVAAADVADEAAASSLFDRLRALFPPVRGVFHVAGVAIDKNSRGTSVDDVTEVLRPKVLGTWILDKLTRDLPLDFFVTFSSVAALWGTKDASYAAANAFLDCFADLRRARSVPVLNVNWGPWAGGGLATSEARSRTFQALGLKPLEPDRALGALERLICASATKSVVVDVDWNVFTSHYKQSVKRRLLDRMEERRSTNRSASRNGTALAWRLLPRDRRRAELEHYFQDRVATVLGLDSHKLDSERPLSQLGLDSLMAIELRAGVEADLGETIPLSNLFDGLTIRQLSDQIADRMDRPTDAPATPPPSALDGVDEHPLSLGQRSLWALQQLVPGIAAYNLAGAARVRAELDVELLRRSFQRIVDRHAALRTTFETGNGEPIQRIHTHAQVWFRIEDAAGLDEQKTRERLSADARQPFDLEKGPLFRAHLLSRSQRDHYLLIVVHHSISDFWSVAVIMDELSRIYAAESSGGHAELEPLALSFTDFVRSQNELLAGAAGDALWNYWRGQLEGPLPVLDLPSDRARPAIPSYRGATRFLTLDEKLTGALVNVAASEGTSLFVTLLAAFHALLSRLSGQTDVIVGSPVAGRNQRGMAGVVGYFANPLPFRANLAANPTFVELVRQVRKTVLDGLEHQEFPFPLMVDRVQCTRDPSRSPIFQAMFVYQKAQRLNDVGLTPFALRSDGARMNLAGVSVESVALDLRFSPFDLTMMAAESDGRIVTSIEYSTDLFEPDTIDRMLSQFETLLQAVSAQPAASVGAISVLGDRERELVLHRWNATGSAFPRELCIHRLFEAQVERTPDAVAVNSDQHSLTYRELNARANRLAHRLQSKGIGAESRVAIYTECPVRMIIGIWAILKSGGAYVPLDREYPRERLMQVLLDADVGLVLTERKLRAELPFSGHALCLDEEKEEMTGRWEMNLRDSANPENLAYVIYTSGSTGKPKGVQVSHRNLVHSTSARIDYYREPLTGFLLLSSFAFDSSVAGLFWSLCRGARLVVPPPAARRDPHALAKLVEEHRISHLLCVPSLYRLILDEPEPRALGALRVAIVAGEPCSTDLVARHRARVPGVALYNEYGPTETTVWCSVARCDGSHGDGPIPIGRPIANTRVYVLDEQHQASPVGGAGELYVGGAGVTRGYLGHPALTAERFIPDPFGADSGSRLYRTGDRARWRADGQLEFLGRSDNQVKIRGFRIELEEIETALSRHPALRDVVVTPDQDARGESRLIAFVVVRETSAPTQSELRRWLRTSLPAYMIPSAFITLDELPLGPNGKVDRRSLRVPEQSSLDFVTDHTAPANATEAALAQIVADMLGVGEVGIFQNLFELGIDSILAIRIVSRARQAGFALDAAQVFQSPTIAELAQLAGTSWAESESGDTKGVSQISARAHQRIAGMGDVEDAFPLSPMQQGMLFHSTIAPQSGVYVQQLSCTLIGALEVEVLERALQRIVAAHPAMRTAVLADDWDEPLQVVFRTASVPLVREDLRQLAVNARDDWRTNYLRADRARGFDTREAPLVRLALLQIADDAHQLIWSNHHLLMDGWCMPLLFKELLTIYEGLLHGTATELPRRRPYSDYITWLSGRDRSQAEAYWRMVLRGFQECTPLGVDRPGVADHARDGAGSVRELRLSPETTANLVALARRGRVTLSTLVQGAWALVLSRYSGREDLVFGVTVSGRPPALAGAESMIGLFINTLPLRVALPPNELLISWLRRLQAAQVEARRYEHTPLSQIQAWSDVPRGQALFESVLVFENFPMDLPPESQFSGLRFESIEFHEQTSYPLTIVVVPGEELSIQAQFDVRRFAEDGVERLLEHMRVALESMAANPAQRLEEIPVLTAEELRQFERWNGPKLVARTDAELELSRLEGLSDEEIDTWLARLEAPEHEGADG
jgi:amino acid adenylation domain-containing protein